MGTGHRDRFILRSLLDFSTALLQVQQDQIALRRMITQPTATPPNQPSWLQKVSQAITLAKFLETGWRVIFVWGPWLAGAAGVTWKWQTIRSAFGL